MSEEDAAGGLLSCYVEDLAPPPSSSSPSYAADGFNNVSNLTLDFEEAALAEEDEFNEFRTRSNLTLTVVSSFGLVGNLMSFVVLIWKLRPRNSFVTLLTGLAISDALFLFSAILGFGLPSVNEWYSEHVFMSLVVPVFGFLHTSRTCSVVLTLSVNVERFFAIVFPLKHVVWKKYLLHFAIGFAVIFNLPKWFEMCVVEAAGGKHVMSTRGLRRNHYYMTYYVFWSKFILVELIPYVSILVLNCAIITKIFKAAHFRKRFTDEPTSGGGGANNSGGGRGDGNRTMLSAASMRLKSLRRGGGSGGGDEDASSSLSNFGGGGVDSRTPTPPGGGQCRSTLHHHSQHRSCRRSGDCGGCNQAGGGGADKNSSSSSTRRTFHGKQREEHQLGWVLVAMSVVFIICQAPKLFPDLYEVLTCSKMEGRRDCPMDGPMEYVIEVSHLTACLNSTLNFAIYSLRGKKFKQAWKETFCCCRKHAGASNGNNGAHTLRYAQSAYLRTTTTTATSVAATSSIKSSSNSGNFVVQRFNSSPPVAVGSAASSDEQGRLMPPSGAGARRAVVFRTTSDRGDGRGGCSKPAAASPNGHVNLEELIEAV